MSHRRLNLGNWTDHELADALLRFTHTHPQRAAPVLRLVWLLADTQMRTQLTVLVSNLPGVVGTAAGGAIERALRAALTRP